MSTIKVLLVCSAGMSTSILVDSVYEEAQRRNIIIELEAVAESQLLQHIEGVDIVLIGPQIQFQKDYIKEKVSEFAVECDVIDQLAFGTMDGEAILNQILSLYEGE